MAVLIDTSALIKHYHTEAGSHEVTRILGEGTSVFSIARLTVAEMVSVFAKKVRIGEIRDPHFDLVRLRFFADIKNHLLIPVRVLNPHFEAVGDLIAKYGKSRQLHTLDALQLAVAFSIRQPSPIDHFVCADQRLCDVAVLEGLAVINPEFVP